VVALFLHRRVCELLYGRPCPAELAKSGSRSRDYEDVEFGDPEHIEFDTDDLIDAAVDVYLESEEILSDDPRSPPVRANSRRSATPGQNRA
jgi:hypothetical protein